MTQAYLDRIAAIDDAGPRLNAVIEINPNALAEADARDAEQKAGKSRGALHGIPVLLKDNIDAVGMVNSAGSLALADNKPARDAFLVERLRAAGAVILGKTNLSEWANFRSTRSTSGWSSRGGQTKNPYVLDRNPCGSSSGTGTAIAASLATIGVGTETDGSIICPASVAGLVGLKPTVGLVSRTGMIPISVTQDTAGPMGRTVSDVALLLTALAGVDENDPAGAAAKGTVPDDYTTFLKADALKGKRLGVLRQAMGFHPDVDKAMADAIDKLKAAGAEVVDVKVGDLQRLERCRVRSAALRIQGRPQYVSEGERFAADVARSADRLEQGERRHARCRSSDRRFSSGRKPRVRSPMPPISRRVRRRDVSPARRGCSRRSTATSSMR